MKYHHSERCFTYRMKRPMVCRIYPRAPSWFGIYTVNAVHGRSLLRCTCTSWGPNRGDMCTNLLIFGFVGSLVSRHLPDGEFGWGGISVTQQRRCPKASSVGTEISRRTQASRLAWLTIFSTNRDCESKASDPLRNIAIWTDHTRGVRKITTGITGLWRPSVHSDVAFWSFDVGSS